VNQPPPDDQQWRVAHLTETYKGLITLAVEGLKMLALVNGAAAIAVLTYVGNLAARGGRPPNVISGVVCYSVGVFLATFAFVLAYVAQLQLYNEELSRRRGSQVPQYHAIAVWFTIGLALLGAAVFGLGCWLVAVALVA
jgi:formate-dependent nitrite reductase membrane component NrfD